MNKYPVNPFGTKNYAFERLIHFGYYNYIDTNKGVCRFDSEDFIDLLEFCNQFPNEQEENGEYYDGGAALRNGTQPFCMMYIDHFDNVKYSEYRQFGEPVTFIGFPGVGGERFCNFPRYVSFFNFIYRSKSRGGVGVCKIFLFRRISEQICNGKGRR